MKRPEQINNKKHLKSYRRELRQSSTQAEIILWTYIQKRQLEGKKFRRQFSVGPFILDFYCPSEKLAVELDGAYHFTEEGRIYDDSRTNYLNQFGITVIRFENFLVLYNIDFVLQEIKTSFRSCPK